MNLLREYIKTLLTEAAYDLSEFEKRGYYISIDDSDGSSFEIALYRMRSKLPIDEIGIISAHRAAGDLGECLDAYVVTWSKVEEKGWGPLLYDLAMEYATSMGSGLAPDRENVSYKANAVWDYYLTNRNDIVPAQLDDMQDHLTPGDSNDNCEQHMAYERGLKGGTFWDEYGDMEQTPWDPYGKDVLLKSPLSKMYRWRGTSNIDTIKTMKRLLPS